MIDTAIAQILVLTYINFPPPENKNKACSA